MAEEKTYIIPLRREWIKVSLYKRATKAVAGVRTFVSKHLKVPVDKVFVQKNLNEEIWKRGIRSPPPKVKVNVVVEDGSALVELYGHKIITKAEKEKAKKKVEKPKAPAEEKKAEGEVKSEQPKTSKAEAPKAEKTKSRKSASKTA